MKEYIILLAAVISLARGEYEEVCSLFPDGVQMREPGNCHAYVTCNNGVGTVTACPNNQLYDKDNNKCVATLSDTYCNDQCTTKSDVWVADQTNCDGYHYCSISGIVHGTCPDGYKFDEASQMCIFPEDSDCYGVSNICGILATNSVKFKDPDNCDYYYVCTKGVLKHTACAKSQYYDLKSGDCISMYDVKCEAHPMPSNVCGTDKSPKYNQFMEDGVTCRGYYYCAYKGSSLADHNPTWGQCPEGTFFQQSSQSCKDPTLVTCKHNRCDGRGNSLVLAEDQYCQHYFECENGLVLGEKKKCPRDMFFDESRQACFYDEAFYSICDY